MILQNQNPCMHQMILKSKQKKDVEDRRGKTRRGYEQ